jgi:flagella basal body P-ring formation protein FlgA
MVFFFLIVLSAFSAERTVVRLKPVARIGGSIVLLGDVAEIVDRDAQIVDGLKRIELFPAPGFGQTRLLRIGEVRELLGLAGWDTMTCQWSGSSVARIESERRARVSDGPPAAAAAAGATDRARPLAVVALRPLERGEAVRDVDVEVRPLETAIRGLVPAGQLSDVVGLQLTRGCAAGQPIDVRDLQRPVLVRRSETITVQSRSAGVVVRARAKALEDAALGDLVTLESLDNRQRYSARVTGLQQADVYAGADASVPASPPSTTPRKANRE